jgi:3-hydroxyacyl-CoA dehydrogenase/enoyl-CoA hydratase/3-hydroxybutyryl-CoA epimerase
MQEGVIQSTPAANLGSIYGWGFPSFKGGVIQYINDYGLEAFLERCGVLQEKFGRRFKASKMLSELVTEPELIGDKANSW